MHTRQDEKLTNSDHILSALNEAHQALGMLIADSTRMQSIAEAGKMLSTALALGARIFSCGNGGSMCDSIHFAEELSGRYRDDRKGLPAVAIADPGHLSCVSNDYGYEFVFSRYLEAHARPGDILLAISTSGSSANVVKAAQHARDNGMQVITLTGRLGSLLGAQANVDICTPVGCYADRVQELHIKVIHILIETVERQLFPANYA